MRVATFNANSIRSRSGVVLQWLKEHEPDVLCIQETKVQDAEFPLAAFESSGYQILFKGQKSYNGVAIFSKAPADQHAAGFDDGGPADEPRLLCARFGKLHVVNTYVPQGREIDHEMYQYKLEWFRRLAAYFKRHFKPEDLLIWTGDLNVAAEPMDVHNPEDQENHVCFHRDVRAAFKTVCGWGFVDVFRKFHPEPDQFTFYDYRTPNAAKRKLGWRIDYILASLPLAAKATGSFIDLRPRLAPQSSDHTFLVADFDV